MPIIVSKNGKKAEVVPESGVEDEGRLQEYVAANPESLPVHDIKENAKLLVVGGEFPTNSGPIDVLALDADGDIYIIETKLYKNPDKRTVVAQVLDYGASLWRGYPDPSRFIAELDRQMNDRAGKGLRQSAAECLGLDEEGADTLVESIKANLQAGNFRFLVLMNRLEDRLKDLVLFLNQCGGLQVYAVEMEFYRHGDLEIVIPKLYGTEIAKTTAGGASGARRRWNEESFFAEVQKNLKPEHAAAVRKVYDFCMENGGQKQWGTGQQRGLFYVKFPPAIPDNIVYVWSDGGLGMPCRPYPDYSKSFQALCRAIRHRLEEAGIETSRMVDDDGDVPAKEWVPRLDAWLAMMKQLLSEGSKERT